jgi:hypothetical protein
MTVAYKFLRPGRVGPFTGAQWPEAGRWLDPDDQPQLCRSGIHALKPSALPTWMTEELWRVELDDAQEVGRGLVLARRGRLMDQVTAWNDDLAREYGEACIAHVPEGGPPIARQRRADALTELAGVRAGTQAASIGYIAAKAVDALIPGGYEAERQWQAAWLSDRLGLSG